MRVGWWDHPAGRAWNITARLVPPRMNTAGSENSGIVASGVDGRIVGDGWSVKLARCQDSPATMLPRNWSGGMTSDMRLWC
jgi:hypothetical protein